MTGVDPLERDNIIASIRQRIADLDAMIEQMG